MKTAWMIGLMAAAGLVVQAQETTPEVTAYASSDPLVPALALAKAQQVATKVFAEIGVPIRWRDRRSQKDYKGMASVTVSILLKAEVTRGFWPGALALTAPDNDGHPVVNIFYSRVVAASYRADLTPVVLGYVLAHEMAHVLQGHGRHSDTGIMKVKWGPEDYRKMYAAQFAFAAEDIMLIRRWIKAAAAEAQIAVLR
jgi:hypothetical protein